MPNEQNSDLKKGIISVSSAGRKNDQEK